MSLVSSGESLWCCQSFLFDSAGLVDEAQESNDVLCSEARTQHQLAKSSCLELLDQSEGPLQIQECRLRRTVNSFQNTKQTPPFTRRKTLQAEFKDKWEDDSSDEAASPPRRTLNLSAEDNLWKERQIEGNTEQLRAS